MTDQNPNTPAPEATGEDLMVFDAVQPVAQRPKSLDRNDLAGTEDIGINDVRLPRLAIAQGLSPEMTPGNGSYIEDLKLMNLFNNLTQTIYGNGPITFVPVRRDVRRMEFRPRSEGGGVIDMDVPVNDERLKWTVEDGVRKPPKATTFIEFVVILLVPGKAPEPIVLSIKTTNKHNRKAADQLTTFIKLRQAAIYAGMYTVASSPATNDKGQTFGVPVIKNAGFIPKDTPAGAKLYEYAKNFHESIADKTIHVDRDEPGDDDFDTDAMDAAGGGSSAPTGDTDGM